MVEPEGKVPMLDTGDLCAVWDAECGVIHLYQGRSAVPADTLSPMEVKKIAAWVRRYKLS